MAEAENKRQRRTPQERANELDEKITKINQSINELEEKKKTHQISGGKKAGDLCSQGSPKAP